MAVRSLARLLVIILMIPLGIPEPLESAHFRHDLIALAPENLQELFGGLFLLGVQIKNTERY